MSTITDRAKDFWDRISPRERKLVVLVAIALPIVLVIWLSFSIRDALDAREAANERTRQALSVLTDLKSRGPATSPEDNIIASLGQEPLSLDTYLDEAAKKAGFTIKGTQPHNPVTRNGFVTSSVALTVDDLEIDKLKTFLQEIETASKVVVVTSLEVTRDRREKSKMDAKLVVSTYSREKKAEGGGGGSAAKKAP